MGGVVLGTLLSQRRRVIRNLLIGMKGDFRVERLEGRLGG